jgi:hypothetical protein
MRHGLQPTAARDAGAHLAGSGSATLAGEVVDAQGGTPGTTAEPELWQALQTLAIAGLDLRGTS